MDLKNHTALFKSCGIVSCKVSVWFAIALYMVFSFSYLNEI